MRSKYHYEIFKIFYVIEKTLKENVGGICHVLRKVWKRNKRWG